MPKFPTYRGEMPECLNPLNLRHYWLLLYWVFFRPTALKCYLYQADPDIYQHGKGWKNIIAVWRIDAYRNLYFMIPVLNFLIITLLGIPFTYFISLVHNGSVSLDIFLFVSEGFAWDKFLFVSEGFAIAGCGFGLLFGMVFGFALGANLSLISSLISSLGYIGAANIFISSKAPEIADILIPISFLILGILLGITLTIVRSFIITILVILLVIWVSFFIISIKAHDSIFSSWLNFIFFSLNVTVVGGGLTFIGAARILFYPFQVVLTLFSFSPKVRHSIEWDEMTVLPFPFTKKLFTKWLTDDEQNGLYLLASKGRNSFLGWTIQATLYSYIHDHSAPLNFLYNIINNQELNEYANIPIQEQDWKSKNNIRNLLFRELSLWNWNSRGWDVTLSHLFAWLLTTPLRKYRKTPLTRFSGMIYELLNEEFVDNTESFQFLRYAKTYNEISIYSGGVEIVHTFDAIAKFLSYNNLFILSQASEITSNLIFNNPIRPTVIFALGQLGNIGEEIAVYRDSTSRANKLAALARANDALKALNEYVNQEVMAPEQYLFRRIIRQWQQLIITAGGELGRAEVVGPAANPYVAGNPVTGNLFVGREDVLRRLEELWRGAGQKPSVVLYGHRRMGKSSILQNLGKRFGAEKTLIYFNMQNSGLVETTGELMYSLALSICDALKLSEPAETDFTTRNPYLAFTRFLAQIELVRDGRQVIIAIDEFELIEQKIVAGKIAADVLEFWRGLFQTHPWFVMAFAGLHTLDEMREDYWHPLFGSVTAIPVSFLSAGAAQQLITQPSPDFDIDYDADAIAEIIRLTHGQPYLVQLICHCLVSRFNRLTYESDPASSRIPRRFRLTDVHAVINAPEFFRDGSAYFTGIWKQAEKSDPAGQTSILQTLSGSESGMSAETLAAQIAVTPQEILPALAALQRHDVVVETNGVWRFTVELMRRWAARK